MSKRWLASMALAIIGCTGLWQSAHAIAVVSVVPATALVLQGDSIMLDVQITDASDLYGFQFDLDFSPEVVAAGMSFEGAFLSTAGDTFFIPGANDNSSGTVLATANTLLADIAGSTGDGILASFRFLALGEGTTTISISNLILLDSSFDMIDSTTSGALVMVEGRSVPEPSTFLLLGVGLLGLGVVRPRTLQARTQH